MKPIKSLQTLFKGLCLGLISISLSCSNEIEIIKQSKRNNSEKISFEQFKNETGLTDFGTSIKVPKSQDLLARNTDGTYELSDFDINVDLIKKLVVNEKITYTFFVTPKIIESKSIFNLTMFYKDGVWQTSILEMKPDSENWEALKSGSTDSFEGVAKNIYRSDWFQLYDCSTIIITYQSCGWPGHCLGDAGSCDNCSQCMDTASFTFCTEAQDSYIAPTIPPAGSGPHTGGGGDPTNLYTDPSGYVADPIFFNPRDHDYFERAERAVDFWHSLSSQPGGQQNWAQENPDSYNEMLEHFLNNYNDENRDIFFDMIDSSINGSAISLSPFFRFPLGSNYAITYPEFTYLVQEYVPTLKDDEDLIGIIHDLTNLPNQQIIDNLGWGVGPEIQIVQLGTRSDGTQYKGKFNPLEPNKIYIDIDLVTQLESDPEGEQRGMLRRMITYAVLLHELVHYADFSSDGIMSSQELGDEFEEILGNGWVLEFLPDNNGNETEEIGWIKVN